MVCWSTLLRLYESLIGRAIFILWLALPIFNVNNFAALPLFNYRICLVGASIIAISYIITKILTPELVLQYKTNKEYVDYLIANIDSILIAEEFKDVDRCENIGLQSDLQKYLPISDHVSVLGPHKSIRLYAKHSYNNIDNKYKKTRFAILLVFLIGILFLLFPTLNAVIQLIGGLYVKTNG
jgi:hypothetical protein